MSKQTQPRSAKQPKILCFHRPISNDVMASFMPEERKRIERHSKRHA